MGWLNRWVARYCLKQVEKHIRYAKKYKKRVDEIYHQFTIEDRIQVGLDEGYLTQEELDKLVGDKKGGD